MLKKERLVLMKFVRLGYNIIYIYYCLYIAIFNNIYKILFLLVIKQHNLFVVMQFLR